MKCRITACRDPACRDSVRRNPARLTADWYSTGAPSLAPALLGKLLCRRLPTGKILRRRITETEAYYGEEDTACHASRGKTERTAVMYRAGGFAYIYLCYGIHWLLNVVSGPVDFPEAVLIRGVEGFDGPGKLTKALEIGKDLKGENLTVSDRLWIEDDGYKPRFRATKRIGIDSAAEKDRNRRWRFVTG
ncbi:MAG: DNA-3-methyladenine glycosylase [Treponema sp.]|nr:DNA-3-methyladenine glycosylase [Treponema sp.]